MIWHNIEQKLTEFANQIKDFFLENGRNPILWVAIVLVGLIVFEFTYQALHKD